MKSALVAAMAILALTSVAVAQSKDAVHHYAVDAMWPKDLPDNWTLGQVSGISVDREDNVWIIHRPRTLVDDGAMMRCFAPSSQGAPPAGRTGAGVWEGSLHGLCSRRRAAD
jgi:hypothetical protein